SQAGTMQYRHVVHAGNFADVHKHVALLQLLESLKKKAKGFMYLDTHAAEGLYDLAGADSRHSGESQAGIIRLEAAAAQDAARIPDAIRHYLDTVRTIREHHGGTRPVYPGSPLLAAASLREVDTAVYVESQAPESRALQRALERSVPTHGGRHRVLHGDGYQALRAHLPPT